MHQKLLHKCKMVADEIKKQKFINISWVWNYYRFFDILISKSQNFIVFYNINISLFIIAYKKNRFWTSHVSFLIQNLISKIKVDSEKPITMFCWKYFRNNRFTLKKNETLKFSNLTSEESKPKKNYSKCLLVPPNETLKITIKNSYL